jgi:peptidoglycan biosynthesis protein MviN/MurJ (putative lipid II flippase)
MLFLLLRVKLGRIDGRNILRSSVKICLASLVMGGVGRLLVRGDMWTESGMVIQKAGRLSAVIALCIALYLLMMRLMKSEELRYLLQMRKKKG